MNSETFFHKIETHLKNENNSDSTISLYLAGVKRFVKFCNKKDVTKITSVDLMNFSKSLFENKKLKSGTVRPIKYGINYAFNIVLKKKLDIDLIPTPTSVSVDKECFTKKELLVFINNLENIKYKAIFQLMYSTGMDFSELSNLKVNDIDSNHKKIKTRNENGTIRRETYLSANILDILRNYFIAYKPLEYLFSGTNKNVKISERILQHTFKANLDKLHINKKLTLRALKNSYIKHLADEGIPLNSILKHLNIIDSKTLKQYSDLCYPIMEFKRSPLDRLTVEGENFQLFDTTDLEYILLKITDKEERDYLQEGINCFKGNALRAGVIFLWTAAIHKIQTKCMKLNLATVNSELKKIYANSKQIKVIDDFEYIKDEYLLDLACNLKIYDKTIKGILKNNCLDLRNKCGHPGRYKPKQLKIKGFVEDIIGTLY